MPRHTKQAIYAFVTFTGFSIKIASSPQSERTVHLNFNCKRLPFVVEINFITSLTLHDALRNAQQRIGRGERIFVLGSEMQSPGNQFEIKFYRRVIASSTRNLEGSGAFIKKL